MNRDALNKLRRMAGVPQDFSAEVIEEAGVGTQAVSVGATTSNPDNFTHPQMNAHELDFKGDYENEEDTDDFETDDEFKKGDHVCYNGQKHVVVVADAKADFVGVTPVGQEHDVDAIDLVHAHELKLCKSHEEDECQMVDNEEDEHHEEDDMEGGEYEEDEHHMESQDDTPGHGYQRVDKEGEAPQYKKIEEGHVKKGDHVKNKSGYVGKITNISGDGEIADVKWYDEKYKGHPSVPVGDLTKLNEATDDLYMSRVSTPKGTGVVYSVNNRDPKNKVVVRLDNDWGKGTKYKGHAFKLEDVKKLNEGDDQISEATHSAKPFLHPELKPEDYKAFKAGKLTVKELAKKYKTEVGVIQGEVNLHADHARSGRYEKVFGVKLDESMHHHSNDQYPLTHADAKSHREPVNTASSYDTVHDKPEFEEDQEDYEMANDTEKVDVPSKILSDLKAVVTACEKESKTAERRDNFERKHYYGDTAKALQMIHDYLSEKTIEGIKRAQLVSQRMANVSRALIPDNVWKFIVDGGKKRSLKDYHNEVKGLPVVGPRNTLDNN